MNMHPQTYEDDAQVLSCTVCGHKAERKSILVFNRGKNLYGIPDGTILCHTCLGMHTKWLKDNKLYTGSAIDFQPEIHAIPLEQHLKNLLA